MSSASERDLRPALPKRATKVSLFFGGTTRDPAMNNVKTFVLMAGLMGLFLLAGQLLGGASGLLLAFVLGGAINFLMYFFSDRLVLRMYGAQVVTEAQAPELYRMVDRLRQRAGLPMPVVAVGAALQYRVRYRARIRCLCCRHRRCRGHAARARGQARCVAVDR